MDGKRILCILGDTWHDFDEFASVMTPVFEAAGYAVQTTYDLETLNQLHKSRYNV